MKGRLIAWALALIAGAFWSTPGGAEGPSVVVSIKPIHSLVSGVMAGAGEPRLLIPGAASPHTYALKPSDAKALADAKVVFWIGEGLETFLEKPLAALPRDARVVALGEQEGLIRLGYREEGPWEAHDRGHDHDGHGHGHGHEKEQLDMHLWLDPVNARVMTAAITRTLSEADPERAALYRTNGEAVAARLAALDSRIAEDLAPIRARAYVVFHDAYQYFEARYGLSPAGSVTVSPERKPSAKRISEIRAKIASSGAACVFSEPQFESSLVKTVIEGSAARSRVLDPLGADLPPGANAYFTLMDRLADSLKGCLAPAS